MITITRERYGWRCVIDLRDTPAKYYAINGSAVDSPHVTGDGKTPHLALDAALQDLGSLTISNPTDAGREPKP
jgi:hypothetical protein